LASNSLADAFHNFAVQLDKALDTVDDGTVAPESAVPDVGAMIILVEPIIKRLSGSVMDLGDAAVYMEGYTNALRYIRKNGNV